LGFATDDAATTAHAEAHASTKTHAGTAGACANSAKTEVGAVTPP
jgi:hypothetical protein